GEDRWTIERGAQGTRPAEHGPDATIELIPRRIASGMGAEVPRLQAQRLVAKDVEPGLPALGVHPTPAVRGRAWTADPNLQNWNPDEGPALFRLAAGAPAGMTVDPQKGKLKWTPPNDFALGPLKVNIAVLGSDPEKPVVETEVAVEVR